MWKVAVQVFLEPCIESPGQVAPTFADISDKLGVAKVDEILMMEVGKGKNEPIMWIALIYVAQQRPQKEVSGVAKRPTDLPQHDFFPGEWLNPKRIGNSWFHV